MQVSGHAASQLAVRRLRVEWIERAVQDPEFVIKDPGRSEVLRAFRRIAEAGNRWLRVAYTVRDGEVVIITAFFDRDARKFL